jgi:hypothetical protein
MEMVQNNLSLDDLNLLAKTLPVKYPLGLVLFRLAEMYEKQRDYAQYQNHLTRFLNDFPSHGLYEKGKDRLESFL